VGPKHFFYFLDMAEMGSILW